MSTYHVQTTTDKGWQTYESFETKEEAIAHKEEWADEFPEVNIRITEYTIRYGFDDLVVDESVKLSKYAKITDDKGNEYEVQCYSIEEEKNAL